MPLSHKATTPAVNSPGDQTNDVTSGTTCSSIFADIKTLGTPAPGWLLAPTMNKPSTSWLLLCGLNQAL
jgi:hypothetical protein